MITQQSIERLLEQTDIVDVVSHYVNLKRSGQNFVGLCPFHDDKNPSMSVNSQLNIFHCFSCKAGGNAIKFIMDYEKLNFPEAVEKLANMQNFSLEYTNQNNIKMENKKILELISGFYKLNLSQNQTALDYLYKRGFDNSLIEKFELGWAPNSQNTINFLKNEGINLEEANEVGILKQSENGFYASFIDRITFAIKNHTGKLVGFGGRTISNHPAKYVNSPESKVFDKSKTLYAYNLSKDEIFKTKEILIVEGYMDVIMLHKAGFKNAVAVLGTALTQNHLPLLRRSDARVILCFDGDEAGINAAIKSARLLSINEIDSSVVIIPNRADPADLIQNGEISKLEKILNTRVESGEFVIKNIVDSFEIQRPQQKQKALNEIKKFTTTLKPIVANGYKNFVAKILNLDPSLVNLSLKNINIKKTSAPNLEQQDKKRDYLELQILKSMIFHKDFFEKAKDIINFNHFKTHFNEFTAIISPQKDENQNIFLRELELDERIEIFTQFQDFKEAIKILLIKKYEDRIIFLKNSNEIDKISQIMEIQKIIRKLKGVK
ncbi:DNA primase [Campylobacter sp. FMV-PI01]|uniref:DNA primase n=1 Tax=Campylobacter portucalensis TaxID=2608384 RepID=A0A6L5WH92_9BACT|nr:DNA primase [Campylobacter portucalensis]MSN96236.1 DNA primase [Campylobacter portucalensis]